MKNRVTIVRVVDNRTTEEYSFIYITGYGRGGAIFDEYTRLARRITPTGRFGKGEVIERWSRLDNRNNILWGKDKTPILSDEMKAQVIAEFAASLQWMEAK